MPQPSHSRSRMAAARLAVIGAVGVGSLAAAPSALASSTCSDPVHLQGADVALTKIGSGNIRTRQCAPVPADGAARRRREDRR
jgi:hypothetical protein